jgi:multidrug transporter EmrE-like cation transporter
MNAILLLILGGVIITGGDIFLKQWATSSKLLFLLVGLFVSLIGLLFLAFGFKSKGLAVANILFIAVNIMTLLLVQIFYFKEKLALPQFLGVIISIIGICLIEFKL